MQITKYWKVEGINILVLQTFVSTYLFGFSKLIIIDKNIIDNSFQELKNIDIILIERDN